MVVFHTAMMANDGTIYCVKSEGLNLDHVLLLTLLIVYFRVNKYYFNQLLKMLNMLLFIPSSIATLKNPEYSYVLYLCWQVRFSTLPPKPVIPSKKPFKVELVGGKRYSWCTCGHSKKQVKPPPSRLNLYDSRLTRTSRVFPHHVSAFQPFCDGAHKLKAPGLFPLRFIAEEDTTVWLCGCKYTNNPPYCDGTHKKDFIVSAPLHAQTDS